MCVKYEKADREIRYPLVVLLGDFVCELGNNIQPGAYGELYFYNCF